MTAKDFLEKYPNAELNENCLEDIACPKCGNRTSFNVEAKTTAVLFDDGTDRTIGGMEYDEDSYFKCRKCSFHCQLKVFMIEGLDDLIYGTSSR